MPRAVERLVNQKRMGWTKLSTGPSNTSWVKAINLTSPPWNKPRTSRSAISSVHSTKLRRERTSPLLTSNCHTPKMERWLKPVHFVYYILPIVK
ncbi:hypothetical protein RSAG8_02958, partial [Rhizoctonia solani AG-8 WAC10335]